MRRLTPALSQLFDTQRPQSHPRPQPMIRRRKGYPGPPDSYFSVLHRRIYQQTLCPSAHRGHRCIVHVVPIARPSSKSSDPRTKATKSPSKSQDSATTPSPSTIQLDTHSLAMSAFARYSSAPAPLKPPLKTRGGLAPGLRFACALAQYVDEEECLLEGDVVRVVIEMAASVPKQQHRRVAPLVRAEAPRILYRAPPLHASIPQPGRHQDHRKTACMLTLRERQVWAGCELRISGLSDLTRVEGVSRIRGTPNLDPQRSSCSEEDSSVPPLQAFTLLTKRAQKYIHCHK
jgi:hypothetical protein